MVPLKAENERRIVLAFLVDSVFEIVFGAEVLNIQSI